MSLDRFRLDGKVAVITGGAGLLGKNHAEAIASAGGLPVILDVNREKLEAALAHLRKTCQNRVDGYDVDITREEAVRDCAAALMKKHGRIDILINNAAMTVESNKGDRSYFSPLEDYPLPLWEQALKVGLTGSFICSKIFGALMAQRRSGVIVNIASDVGLISPDHRIYRPEGDYPGVPFNTPLSYVAIKAALINMTRYMATYWADRGVRVNALSPAGVYNNHDERFVKKLTHLIPLGRMASQDEYKGAILFLCSDASRFMTGANLVVDGGRTAW